MDYVFSVILGCLEVRIITASTLILFSDANWGKLIFLKEIGSSHPLVH